MTTESSAAVPAHRAPQRCGVLFANLGTPDAPTAPAIRRYLREFLSDRRVVEVPRPIWLAILYGFILPLRPRRLAHAYQSVWTDAGSPLLAISRQQVAGLQRRLGEDIPVALGMRYGQPGIGAALAELEQRGVRRILVLPAYPQYSATTTASVFDAVLAHLQPQRWFPELRLINSYHDDEGYIDALAASVQAHWQQHGRGEHLLMSFHSIPLRNLQLGDPYYCFSQKTARLLAAKLGLGAQDYTLSFQSRIGRARWLSPYTDHVIARMGATQLKTLDVICPGFAADCLETLEEVSLRYSEQFATAGGGRLRYIAALNAGDAHLDALANLARRHLSGWPAVSMPEAHATGSERIARLQRDLQA